MGILQLLAKENYITYHKTLAKNIGVDEAILFGELCSMSNLYGYEFFCEQSRLVNDTCLTEYRIRNAMKTLQKENLVSVVKKGLPAKNYYMLHEERLLEILECQSTSDDKFDTTGGDKFNSTGDCNFDSTGDSKFDSTFNKNTVSKNTNKNTVSKNTNNSEPLNKTHKVIKSFPCLEKIETTGDELLDTLQDFADMRKQMKAPMTDRAMKILLNKLQELSNGDVQNMIAILNQSIMNSWKSVYPIKDDSDKKQGGGMRGKNEQTGRNISETWVNKHGLVL